MGSSLQPVSSLRKKELEGKEPAYSRSQGRMEKLFLAILPAGNGNSSQVLLFFFFAVFLSFISSPASSPPHCHSTEPFHCRLGHSAAETGLFSVTYGIALIRPPY